MIIRTQNDLIREEMMARSGEMVRRVKLPGIETLHTRSTAEIAEVLTMVLKMENNIIQLNYKIGEYIDLVIRG